MYMTKMSRITKSDEGHVFPLRLQKAHAHRMYFNRIDTKAARESRREIWKFLAGYLKPDRAAK